LPLLTWDNKLASGIFNAEGKIGIGVP
jgi:hypothetical protein